MSLLCWGPGFKNKTIRKRLSHEILEQLKQLVPSLNHFYKTDPFGLGSLELAEICCGTLKGRMALSRQRLLHCAGVPVEKHISLVEHPLQLQPHHAALLNALQLNRRD